MKNNEKKRTAYVTNFGKVEKMGADRLAYACAREIQKHNIDARSEIADALLDYLEIGSGGTKSVPEWMSKYENKNTKTKI